MSRRSVIVAVGIVVFLTCSVGTGLFLLLHYEPDHYRRCAIPPGDSRIHDSQAFYSVFSELLSDMNGTAPWQARFTDQQINSYLNEAFVHSGLSDKLLPEGISEPRVAFEPERMRLSFRYRSRFVNTVVSVTLRIWLPRSEPNVVALQLQGLQAGLVPFTAQWLLERISEVARQNGIEVSWYRHEGYPVALLRFQADQPQPTLQLQAVQFEDGSITIRGRSNEARTQAPGVLPFLALLRR
jgi:hypothetical protein